jgi:hypothetical protein
LAVTIKPHPFSKSLHSLAGTVALVGHSSSDPLLGSEFSGHLGTLYRHWSSLRRLLTSLHLPFAAPLRLSSLVPGGPGIPNRLRSRANGLFSFGN